LKEPISKETLEEVRKSAGKTMSERPTAVISATNGLGCNADHALIAFHRNYAEYCEFMNLIRHRQIVAVDEVKASLLTCSTKTNSSRCPSLNWQNTWQRRKKVRALSLFFGG
jgi:hypothetical protein